jgi:hypothetical protein
MLKDFSSQGNIKSMPFTGLTFPFKIGNNLTIFVVAAINPIGVTSNGTNFKFHP